MEETKNNRILGVFKVIYNTIIWGLIALTIILLSAFCYSAFIKKDRVPNFFGYSFLTIATGSMHDAIEIGDMVIVKDTNDYEVGDVITFWSSNDADITTTHRIIRIEGEKIFTKGDANESEDGFIYKNQIVGEVICVLPKVGLVTEWIKTPIGIFFTITTIGIIILGIYLLKKS